VLHAIALLFAYQSGFFNKEDIDSIPAKTISISIVEPTPVAPPPPVSKPVPEPVKKRKIVTKAPSPKVVDIKPAPVKQVIKPTPVKQVTKPTPVKQVTKPKPPIVEKKVATSPLPAPVSKPATFSSPKPTYQPKPKYPTIARRRGIEGAVIFEISIANNGQVTNAIMVESSGSSALDRSAAKAIKTWRFPASKFNSMSSFKQRIEFRLNPN
jgi:protein TonB